jgi:hypothetical protein
VTKKPLLKKLILSTRLRRKERSKQELKIEEEK